MTNMDVVNGSLEISAWHSAAFDKVLIGRVYIPLRQLRPGYNHTEWYLLS
ncbi:unnamed protein product [Protopolystoma xenopodis]|uniref:Uncharacterized protein n=1 Tax=Protopolystoma xenopodis TaxID=117903 RepID=A0A448WRE3_9PLAT|nr:unnamed protein product [Protopolystoma xenopodis]